MTIDPKAIAANAQLQRDASDVATALEFERLRATNPFKAAQLDMHAMTRGRAILAAQSTKDSGPEAA